MLSNLLSNTVKIGVTIIALCGGFTACRDTTQDSTPFRSTSASARSADAKAALHSRNEYDWVGVSHNKALDEFARELRVRGTSGGSFCAALAQFLGEPARVPADRRGANERERASLAQTAVGSVAQCKVATVRNTSVGNEPAPPLQTSAAAALYDQALSALELSETSTELAQRLNTILDASSQLSPEEQVLIAIVVSVAQNSYEYWESNGQSFIQAAKDMYGPCTRDRVLAGLTFESGLESCLNSGFFDQPISGPARVEPPLGRVARSAPAPRCDWNPVPGIKKILAADLKGGWSGFFSGAIAGGRAVEGALIGAAGSSVAAGVALAVQQFICIMQT